MKKAILIVGIISMVICLSLGIFEIIWGIGDLIKLSGEGVEMEANVAAGVTNIIIGCWLLAGAVLALITVLKRNSDMSKKAGITLGVFSIIFGAEVSGILFIVDSAMNRK